MYFEWHGCKILILNLGELVHEITITHCVLYEVAGTGHSSGLHDQLKYKSGKVPESDVSIRLAKLVILTHPTHFFLVVCRNLSNFYFIYINTQRGKLPMQKLAYCKQMGEVACNVTLLCVIIRMFRTREKFPELCNVGITLEVEIQVLKNNLPL